MNYDGKGLPSVEQVVSEFNSIVQLLPEKNIKYLQEQCKKCEQLQQQVFDQENQNDIRYDQELSILHNSLANQAYDILLLQLLAQIFNEKFKQPVPQLPESLTTENINKYMQQYDVFLQQINNVAQSVNADQLSNMFQTQSQNFNQQILIDTKKLIYNAHKDFWPLRKRVGETIINEYKDEKEKQIFKLNELNQKLADISDLYLQSLSSQEGLIDQLKGQIQQLESKPENQENQYNDIGEIESSINKLINQYDTKIKESQKRKIGNPDPRECIKSTLNDCIQEVHTLCERKQDMKSKVDEVKYNSIINELTDIKFCQNNDKQLSLNEQKQKIEYIIAQIDKLQDSVDNKNEDAMYDLLGELMEKQDETKTAVPLNMAVQKLKNQLHNELQLFQSSQLLTQFVDDKVQQLQSPESIIDKLYNTQNNVFMQLETFKKQLEAIDTMYRDFDVDVMQVNLYATAAASAIDSVALRVSERAITRRDEWCAEKTDAVREFVAAERRAVKDKYEVALQLCCPVCLSRPVQAILECGHPMCRQCAQSLTERSKRNAKCYVCSSQVEKYFNIRTGGGIQ